MEKEGVNPSFWFKQEQFTNANKILFIPPLIGVLFFGKAKTQVIEWFKCFAISDWEVHICTKESQNLI